MTIKQLREHLEMKPFRPIVIRTGSGARHPVKHPGYLFMHPVGRSHVEAVETAAKSNRSR